MAKSSNGMCGPPAWYPRSRSSWGPVPAGAVYSPAITDFTVMVKKTSNMFVTGPQVIKTVTSEEVTAEALGGAMAHNTKSGVAHFAEDSDQAALDRVREILAFLPQNCREMPPAIPCTDDPMRTDPGLNNVVPTNPRIPYDIRDIINSVLDHNEFMEVQASLRQNMVVGFGRLNGMPVGIVANQPKFMAGCLDINASMKCARLCEPAMLQRSAGDLCGRAGLSAGRGPGTRRHHQARGQNHLRLLRSHGPENNGGHAKSLRRRLRCHEQQTPRGDINYAYPTAEIAVMGPEGAVNIIFRKEIAEAEDPEAKRKELVDDYRNNFASPFKAAELGYIDQIIFPENTRPRLIKALMMLKDKKQSIPARRHGNCPL
jgi:propionyl-CoA carboxylase beta chain